MASTERVRTAAPMVIDVPGAFDSGWLEGSAFGQAVAGQMPWDDPQLDDDDRALGAAWAKARHIGGPRGSYRLRLNLDDVEAVWALMEMARTAEDILTDPEERGVKRAAATTIERCTRALLEHYQQQFPVKSPVTYNGRPMNVAGVVLNDVLLAATVVLYGPPNELVGVRDPALIRKENT